jgi:predicted Zn finger-like uncharacterized protein
VPTAAGQTMVITCPNCRTRFQLPPSSLGPRGRNVRCSSCGNRWFVEPFPEPAGPAAVPFEAPAPVVDPAPVAAPPEPAPPVPTVEPTPLTTAPAIVPTRRAQRRGNGVAGWLTLALVVLLLVGAVVGRNLIVGVLPAAIPIYERLGLPVTVQLGLAFRDLGSARHDEAGSSTVVVTGTIVNTAGREVRVPKLRIALLDEGHQEIQSGFYDPPRPTLPTDGTAPFEIALENPPEQARDFTITFADRP